MRVALSFPACHRRGGVERIVLECANFLASRGHDTHLLTSEWDAEALNPAITTHYVPIRTRPAIARPITFARQSRVVYCRLQPPDVLGAFGVFSPPGGVLWVQSVHKAWLEISGRQRDLRGRLKQKIYPQHPLILAMERDYFGGRRYRKLIALTERVKDDLMRLYGVPDEDIVIIPNGFAPNEFNPQRREQLRSEMRLKLGYRDTDKVVVFVANELERKGFGPLLRAIASLNDSNIHLLAVGRLDPNAYTAEIERLGMSKRVQFPGPSSDVATYYAASDVFALPTQYEAWGLVIVEAMACGLPALTSRLAGAAIAVEEGRTGELLDDPSDVSEIAHKLSSLLSGASQPPEAISQSVQAYAWSEVLLRYESTLAASAV